MTDIITVDLTDDDITQGLDLIAAGLSDMTEVMQDLGELLGDSTEERFAAGQAPDGSAWAPKSQATIDAYRRNGDKADVRPLFGPSGRLSSEIHYEATADSVEIGSSLIYAAVQQLGAAKGAFGTASNGSSIPWGDIPARPYLGISEDDKVGITETIEDWLMRIAEPES